MLKKLKKNKKKGFTLVERIVVLVILAILAALLIPALTGYIDKAKEKSITAETRQTVMAAQTLLDEAYGATDNAQDNSLDGNDFQQTGEFTKAKVAKLAEVSESNIVSVKVSGAKITELVYKDTKAKKQCTYTKAAADGSKGKYVVEDIKNNNGK